MSYPFETVSRLLAESLSEIFPADPQYCVDLGRGIAGDLAAIWPETFAGDYDPGHDRCRCGVFLDERENYECRECTAAAALRRLEQRRLKRSERVAAGEQLCVARLRQHPKGELCLKSALLGADRCETHLPAEHNALRCRDMGYAYARMGLSVDEVRRLCAKLAPEVADIVWSHAMAVESREATRRFGRAPLPSLRGDAA